MITCNMKFAPGDFLFDKSKLSRYTYYTMLKQNQIIISRELSFGAVRSPLA